MRVLLRQGVRLCIVLGFSMLSYGLFAILFLLFSSISWAQEVGIVSYIDIEGGGLRAAECLAAEADPRVCALNVEVVVLEAFNACGGNLSGCETSPVYAAPFIPEASGEATEEDIDVAWDDFVNKTIDEVSSEINQLLPCWLPTPCPPQVDWTCVAERLLTALSTAYTDYLPDYWLDVYSSVATNAPFALHWRSAAPGDGAIIAPIFSLTPKPDQYAGLGEAARDYAYYFQEPLFPSLHVPYLPDEPDPAHGGLAALEQRKRDLGIATLPEYQQFGFTHFFQVYGEYRLELLFKLLRGPYLVAACLIPSPPFIVPFPVPVPAPVYLPRAFTDWVSVPEGYGIPRVEGDPLY